MKDVWMVNKIGTRKTEIQHLIGGSDGKGNSTNSLRLTSEIVSFVTSEKIILIKK